MPRPSIPNVLARLGEAIADRIRDVLDTVLPGPQPDRLPVTVPVRVRERR